MDFSAGDGTITAVGVGPKPGYGPLDTARDAAAAFLQFGAVSVVDVKSMVTRVVAQAAGGTVHRLNINDHGDATGFYIGKDWITEKTFGNYAPLFVPLLQLLAKDAWVHLQVCEVGQNEELLRVLALAFGVPVYAGTGTYAAKPYSHQFGTWVRCSPSGTIYRRAYLPGESNYRFAK